ncbi:hypothetical protein ABZX85_02155 [Streptomyces sp. NPDC004539]|uniref:hypothetical protein n=1 Tax=Streptomyces sp. NPDC004539 TaxID=3154280 RepID=UPI0033AEF26D
MTRAYKALRDAELRKAFDVWGGYLAARTGEDPLVLDRLRSLLESARENAAEQDLTWARELVDRMYEEAREGGLRWAPTRPRPREADAQARDYAKDVLPEMLSRQLRDRIDSVRSSVSFLERRFRDAPGLDEAVRQDALYLAIRAETALDLVHLRPAERELERLRALARWWGLVD